VDALHDLDEGRRAANLEADIDRDLSLRALRDLESFAGLRDIDAHRLFAVGVLASGDDGFQMLDVKEGRGRDLDGIDIFRGR
jgi:hypothetical protein